MSMARDLADRLPATLALLRAGGISHRHTIDLVDATRSLPAGKAALVEERVLGRAGEQTPAQFRACVKRAVLSVTDPVDEEAAHQDAVAERRVVFTPAPNGMTEQWSLLPADGAATLNAALDAMAHATIHQPGGDPRTADQRRADALVDLARNALAQYGPTGTTTSTPGRANPSTCDSSTGNTDPADTDRGHNDPAGTDPTCGSTDPGPVALAEPSFWALALAAGHGQRPAIGVTIAASTLMGLDHQPCELDGYGPITAAMARRIAADPTATWRRLLTDDDGLVRHAGVTTYRPPPDMTRTVIARDQHCQFPGCRRPARYNDLDHVQAYEDGDETTEANLLSLCRRHHRLKHSGRWHVERDDTTGITTWTDSRGRNYLSRPPTLPTTALDPPF